MCVTHGENRFHEGKAKDRKNGRQGIRVCVSWSAWLKEILLANGINSTIKSVGRPATVCSVSRSCFSSTYKERKREFQRNDRFSKMARDSFVCTCVCMVMRNLYQSATKTTNGIKRDISTTICKRFTFLIVYSRLQRRIILIKGEELPTTTPFLHSCFNFGQVRLASAVQPRPLSLTQKITMLQD